MKRYWFQREPMLLRSILVMHRMHAHALIRLVPGAGVDFQILG